jgi:hypothetical protein
LFGDLQRRCSNDVQDEAAKAAEDKVAADKASADAFMKSLAAARGQ